MRRGRCVRCILPVTFPNIKFNEDGVCNYCQTHVPFHYDGKIVLRNLLQKYRCRGNKYDCIVPISGGKDSTYVLYSAVKEFGMRALAMNYDSGFTTDHAKRNLKNAFESLHVDYVKIQSKHDIQRKCLKSNIEAWLAKPGAESFPELCYGCSEGYKEGAYRIARQMRIPVILLGDAEIENDISQAAFHRLHKSYILHLAMRFRRNQHYLHPLRLYHYLLVQADTLANRVYRTFSTNTPFFVHWFNYVPYDTQRILSTIIDNVGWSKPDSSASGSRFDCKIGALKDRMYRQIRGYSIHEEVLSKMIREGTVTRNVALEAIEQEKNRDDEEASIARDVLRQLDMSYAEDRMFS
ncbi:MAG: hypothetical protein WB643_07125 [Candidatus Bathyarchaeia archaeon]